MQPEGYSIKKAAMINAIGKYSKVLLSIVVEVVLARLLTPHDYGIVAVVTVFTTFFAIFSDMGLGTAIIQRKNLTKEDINQIYTFSVYLGVILTIIFFFASYGIASFYKSNVYIKVGQLLSLSLLFNTLNMVPNGILNREKKFVAIAVRTLVVYLVSVVITIILAFFGARYYALVFQAISSAFFTYLWNYLTTKPKFKLRYNNSAVRKVASYSGFQFLFNLLNYFSRNLDNLLAGRFIGSTQLGYYNKAYTLMQYPVSNLAGVITPVLHPILSDYQDNKDVLYQKYMNILKLLMAVGVWAEAVCIFAAPEIIGIMYGSNWSNSIICFKLLAISIATQMMSSSAGAAFQALGNTKLMFVQGCINTAVTVVSILIGIFSGRTIYALALWVSISFIVNFIISYFFLVSFAFKNKFVKFIKEILPYIIIGMILVIAVLIYPEKIGRNMYVSCFLKIVYITFIYIIGIVLTGQKKYILSLIFR
ncbi:polysaccharide biosynthesis protein [Ligilactobacillus agilis DSM 20509]|uniref:Polysaccharide biosynthesis protein n=1 Tax=Ligilactobacillus agilis DSM 20509 TaxID=1423718 RepID=A0A0R2AKN4_9LACO|nr:lipopolysaccharide biosynthesis protein [Ligilactobacillus agilis]KRM63955.1 polysaccharide biosynthesis protein [Ligilactobacillus agilis DSM 20509]